MKIAPMLPPDDNKTKGMPASVRYDFLDAIRGYALLAITVNHISILTGRVGREGGQLLTLTQVGYSSAAELFVAVSGFLFGVIYLRKHRGRRDPRLLFSSVNRSAKIYVYNIFLFALLLGVTQLFPLLADAANVAIDGVIRPDLFASAIALKSAPFLASVLSLYVYLIIVFIILCYSFETNVVRVFFSFSLYLLGITLKFYNIHYGINIEFDILTWQLIFVVPAIIGGSMTNGNIFVLIKKPLRALIICAALFFVSACVKAAEFKGFISLSTDYPSLFDKETLGIVRIAHATITFLMLALFFEYLKRIFAPAFSFLARIGSVSLEAYCCSAVITYVMAGIWLELGGGRAIYFVVTIAGAIVVALFSTMLHTFRKMDRAAKTAASNVS